MNRFSRIRHHVDMKDVRKRHLEESAAKKLEEKRLKEEAEQIKAEYEKWKSNWRDDILDEGMSTQMLTGILPSAGNTDLDILQLGASGTDLSYTTNGDVTELIFVHLFILMVMHLLTLHLMIQYTQVLVQHNHHTFLVILVG